MTDKQPKALRLADELDGPIKTGYWEAAAELRRLHAANVQLVDALPDLTPIILWLKNGCDPKEAAKELEIHAAAIKAAKEQA